MGSHGHIIKVTQITAEAVIPMMGDHPYEIYDACCVCEAFRQQQLPGDIRECLFYEGTGRYYWNVTDEAKKPAQGFLGFHIHEGAVCAGNEKEPFADTGAHYSRTKVLHPDHAGDLPPLLFTDGFAWMQVYTGRFTPEEIIGRTVILHGMPADHLE